MAEGELFREAIASAAQARGLHVHRLPARQMFSYAAVSLDLAVNELTRSVQDVGKALGPPWRKDEKEATLAAWVALVSDQSSAPTS
jgi:hypothetical protein